MKEIAQKTIQVGGLLIELGQLVIQVGGRKRVMRHSKKTRKSKQIKIKIGFLKLQLKFMNQILKPTRITNCLWIKFGAEIYQWQEIKNQAIRLSRNQTKMKFPIS